jgi:predicted transcriptional regulator
MTQSTLCFNGDTFDSGFDSVRLTGQILRIYNFMKNGKWNTLEDIEVETGDPQASISAQLRHLRKARFGGHTVEKRRKGSKKSGLWEYRLKVNPDSDILGWD